MNPIKREEIHLISRHSNWPGAYVDQLLKNRVYHHKPDWQHFLRLFFLTMGIGFASAGIIFFFAYNWDNLHKFVKLGLIASLIISSSLVVIFTRLALPLKQVILTGSALLTGCLFAVFGQIYQTGADSYDLFLGWTILITIWVVVAHFSPLWLLYIALINVTIVLYADQVAKDWSPVLTCTILFLVNTLFVVVFRWLSAYRPAVKYAHWFTHTITLAAVSCATIGMTIGIMVEKKPVFYVLLLTTLILYGITVLYALKEKSLYYLAVIGFSTIIIVSAAFIKISSNEYMFLLQTLFIITSVTLLIKKMIDLQKKWHHEK
jgi:uncharacterized membrane protein